MRILPFCLCYIPEVNIDTRAATLRLHTAIRATNTSENSDKVRPTMVKSVSLIT